MAENLAYILVDDPLKPEKLAFYENGILVECWCDNAIHKLGSIHLARITTVHQAHRRVTGQLFDGTLVSWQVPHKHHLQSGQLALVTLTAYGWQDKPIQASMGAQLAGHHGILKADYPLSDKHRSGQIRWSQKSQLSKTDTPKWEKICSDPNLQACASQLGQQGFDLVLRRHFMTAARKDVAQATQQLKSEADLLISDWKKHAIQIPDRRAVNAACLIYPGLDLVLQASIYAGTNQIRKAEEGAFEQIKIQLEDHLKARHDLSCGAVLWIEPTHAAVMVDIDSGHSKLSPFALAQAILPELMTELRLRGLAGRILIDLPYLTKKQQQHITELLDLLIEKDPRAPESYGFSPSGWLELRIRYAHLSLDSMFKSL